ncbi:MAG: hypothetical protein KGQ59_11410 [Bdellovibrionales bacterium]|nr:hypothetical protein [Bdellovibrionales bacterium]
MSSTSSHSRRRLKSKEEHSGGGERWLVSYADLITLLFALFVVLYATSQSDLKKFKEVSDSMKRAFSSSKSEPLPLLGQPGSIVNPNSETGESAGVRPLSWNPSNADTELAQILRLLEEAAELEPSVHRHPVEDSGEIRWIIQDSYPQGVSRVNEDFWPLLRRVARVLAKFPHRSIRWEGHADPAEFAQDSKARWRVSVERVEWIQEFMSREWQSMGAAQRKSPELAALGSSRVLSPEESAWARARNRRVELVILPRK